MDGLLNIYKEKDFTSHDVVAVLRGITGQRKIGHTGTLDPQAEGVLPVCLGKATRAADMLEDTTKEYRCTMLLGKTSDTEDIWGTILSDHAVCIGESQAEEALKSFLGSYDQIPPMYSARKVNGKKLYELARSGKEIERAARRVEIYELEIEEIEIPRIRFRVSCSKGTYVRSLCRDAGEKLGCGGLMESLTRTRAGMFRIEDALRLSEVRELAESGRLADRLIPIDRMFAPYPETVMDAGQQKYLENGNRLPAGSIPAGQRVRVYDSERHFAGIYECRDGRWLYPVRFFYGESGR